MKKGKLLNGINTIFIIIALFSIFDWAFPRFQRLFDDSAKLDYQLEERYSMLENAYSDGLRFGDTAASYYEEHYDEGDDIESIAQEQYEKKEPSSIYFGPDDYYDFPDKEYLKSWTWRSLYGEQDTNDLVAAFKSGYLDGFVQYYNY